MVRHVGSSFSLHQHFKTYIHIRDVLVWRRRLRIKDYSFPGRLKGSAVRMPFKVRVLLFLRGLVFSGLMGFVSWELRENCVCVVLPCFSCCTLEFYEIEQFDLTFETLCISNLGCLHSTIRMIDQAQDTNMYPMLL